MVTIIDEKIGADSTLGPLVQKADGILRQLFSRVQHAPSATWRPSSLSQSGSLVELEFMYDVDYVARDFSIEQLLEDRELRFAFTSLWGDLIMLAYGKSSVRLIEALREIRKEEAKQELHLQGA